MAQGPVGGRVGGDVAGQSQGAVETELKFEVPADGARLSLSSLVGAVPGAHAIGAARAMTQTATYYDTPDLALLASKRTLRRRTGGTDAGWHLKTPGGAIGSAGAPAVDAAVRREFHEPLGHARSGPPIVLREQVEDIVGREVLLPVAVMRTVRVRRELLAADGRVLALLEDDSVQAWRPGRSDESAPPIVAWRELEVELVEGGADDLTALADALAAAGFVLSRAPSKLNRALEGLGLRPGPSSAVPADVMADPSGERLAVWRYLAAQVGVLESLEAQVVRDEPDAVHKTRVATRRLRATLRTIRPWLDTQESQAIRLRVRWLTRVLAPARDGEVVRARLLASLDDLPRADIRGPVRRRMVRSLDAAHAQAHARGAAAMRSPRFARLIGDLLELLLDLPWIPNLDDAPGVPQLLDASRRRVRTLALRAEEAADATEREFLLHEVRKKAKAARYAVEASQQGGILAEQSGLTKGEAAAAADLDSWVDLQELLGDHQDAVVAREVLRRLAREARAAGEDTDTYGVLVGRETQRIAEGDARMEGALEEALG